MRIIKSEVPNFDLEKCLKNINYNNPKSKHLYDVNNGVDTLMKNNKQHYRLLAYMSTKLNDTLILDIGTHLGASACALSYNNNNKIITYDLPNGPINFMGGIVDNINLNELNIEYRLCNIMNNETEKKNLLNASLIFLDTAHTGEFEWSVYTYLLNNNYRGILVLDDIHFTPQMRIVWNNIKTTKYDVTDIGHNERNGETGNTPGTGIVDFSDKISLED